MNPLLITLLVVVALVALVVVPISRTAWFREFVGVLFSTAIYKRNQGRLARQVTFAALALVPGIGVWRLSQFLPLWFGELVEGGAEGVDLGVLRFLIPGGLLAAVLWFCYRLVNVPRFADFLVAVEAEMAKVSWPSAGEVMRSSAVIIFLIFAMALILAGYDLFWWFFLRNVVRMT